MKIGLEFIYMAVSTAVPAPPHNYHDRLALVHEQLTEASSAVCSENAQPAGCGGRIFVAATEKLNAWSHDGLILVSPALMDIANDDELAFVIAHEMAHNMRNNKKGRAAELEADRIALKIVHNAGFRIEFSSTILLKSARGGVSLGYPTRNERLSSVGKEILRIRQASRTVTAANAQLSPTRPEA